ncbi:MAG TPA: GNAT family N-acetyltransferase [Aggregatilineales bacterium]|nr:GNAT family N-acetyltransferase [Aggregatilineales bacterium]
MQIDIQRAAYPDVEAMRELYRYEAGCQIIHDSHLRCQLADPYLILVNGRLCGYGGISNKAPHRLIEFYVQPAMRRIASTLLRELLAASGAAAMAAQTNMPLMLMLLYEFAQDITREAILFEDAEMTHHTCTQGVFRQATPAEAATIFPHHHEPVGNWVIDTAEGIVATGGFLTHYNPPYGDIFMEVRESARRRGFGRYLVQELKRVCYEAGKKPAARCDPTNTESRRTLESAGLLPCGYLLTGRIDVSV